MVESSLQTGYVKHAPGFVENEGPKLITSRFKHADSFTLDKYLSTGGYEGLKSSLNRSPGQVHDEVRDCLLYTSPSPRD